MMVVNTMLHRTSQLTCRSITSEILIWFQLFTSNASNPMSPAIVVNAFRLFTGSNQYPLGLCVFGLLLIVGTCKVILLLYTYAISTKCGYTYRSIFAAWYLSKSQRYPPKSDRIANDKDEGILASCSPPRNQNAWRLRYRLPEGPTALEIRLYLPQPEK